MEGIPNIITFQKRHDELELEIQKPDFYNDQRRAGRIAKEHQKLNDLIQTFGVLEEAEKALTENKAIANDSKEDPELKEIALEEIPELEAKLEALKQTVLVAMIPPDQANNKNTIIEIRGGAGGDEASLFAGDLFRMYSRYADIKGWKIEPMSTSLSESGGYKEVSFLVSGDEVYKTLKFESGVHRVQRIPTTETNGRIHTSTATVAVLPEAEDVDIQIDNSDLEITACRASGPGGQGVNTTDSAVQIIHKPTGMMVNCADERSQLKNKAKALKVLQSRLLQLKEDEEKEKYAAHRKDQIGTGDRSERIRTYNFPQSRLTDHRIGLTLHSLPQVLEGELNEVTAALEIADQEAKIKALLEEGLN